jgi:hypothetical protein
MEIPMDIVANQTSAREYLSPGAKAIEESLMEEFNVLPTNEDPNYRYLNILFNNFGVGGISIQDLIRTAAKNFERDPNGVGMQNARVLIQTLANIVAGSPKRTTAVSGLAFEFRCTPRKGTAMENPNQVTMKDLLASLLG